MGTSLKKRKIWIIRRKLILFLQKKKKYEMIFFKEVF